MHSPRTRRELQAQHRAVLPLSTRRRCTLLGRPGRSRYVGLADTDCLSALMSIEYGGRQVSNKVKRHGSVLPRWGVHEGTGEAVTVSVVGCPPFQLSLLKQKLLLELDYAPFQSARDRVISSSAAANCFSGVYEDLRGCHKKCGFDMRWLPTKRIRETAITQ